MKVYDNPACRITLPNGPQLGMYEGLRDLGIITEGGATGEYASDPIAAQAFINAWKTSDSMIWAMKTMAARVDAYAKNLRDTAVSGISAGEMASWPIKRSEAAAFVAAGGGAPGAAAAPNLAAEATARNVTLAALVNKVNTKVNNFLSQETSIAGVSGKHKDAISNQVTPDAVMSYNYLVGWP